MKYSVIFILIFLIISAGCAKKQTVTQEPMGEEDIFFEEMSEDTTDISEIVFEEETDTTEESSDISVFEEVEPETGEEDISFTEEEETEPSKAVKRHGYRVQIAAYETKSSADSHAERARRALNKEVYVEHVMPYYKVRVGNFVAKSDAYQYRRELINRGYKGAFVVETTIIVE